MTLLEEIQSKCSPALLASRDHQAIADAVNVGRTKIASRIGGVGTIMDTLGADGGATLLDNLEAMSSASSAVKWGMRLILAGNLDFGLDSTRSMITALVPSPAKEALLAVAEVPDAVSEFDVRCALYAADGTFLG
jgi:hypothetical protein